MERKIKVIKPPVCHLAMCVYRFTLTDGSYYIGASTNFGDRILSHLKLYRSGKHSPIIQKAMDENDTVTFEFLEFVNDKSLLGLRENYHLSVNVGKPLCLNQKAKSEGVYVRGFSVNRIAKFDKKGKIEKIYDGIAEAARDLKLDRSQVIGALNAKFYSKHGALRKIDKNDKIVKSFRSILELNPNKIAVNKYDKKMNFLEKFESIADAAKNVNVDRGYMRIHLKGTKSCRGFVFRIAED